MDQTQSIQQRFGAAAAAYAVSAVHRGGPDLDAMLATGGASGRERVLDVGCGIGDPTLQVAVLVGPHGRVLGIDLVEEMLATARERAAALGLGHVEFRAGDVTTLELAPHAWDAVLGRFERLVTMVKNRA